MLMAMHESAWDAYKNSNDLRMVIDRIIEHKANKKGKGDVETPKVLLTKSHPLLPSIYSLSYTLSLFSFNFCYL